MSVLPLSKANLPSEWNTQAWLSGAPGSGELHRQGREKQEPVKGGPEAADCRVNHNG